MRNFWKALEGSKLQIGKASATGLGVVCLTVIVIVVTIV